MKSVSLMAVDILRYSAYLRYLTSIAPQDNTIHGSGQQTNRWLESVL